MINGVNDRFNGVDHELLTDYLVSISENVGHEEVRNHKPDPGRYWRALDLVLVAFHLSGGRVWGVEEYTGGLTVTSDRRRVERYMNFTRVLSKIVLRKAQSLTEVTLRPGNILISLVDSKRLENHIHPAIHIDREPSEYVATSARLSDIDQGSRQLIMGIFCLKPGFDTEFVHPARALEVVGGAALPSECVA